MAGPDLNIKDVIDALDSFYCHNVVAGLWTDAVAETHRRADIAAALAGPGIPA